MATHFRLEKFCLNPHIVDITSDFHLKGLIFICSHHRAVHVLRAWGHFWPRFGRGRVKVRWYGDGPIAAFSSLMIIFIVTMQCVCSCSETLENDEFTCRSYRQYFLLPTIDRHSVGMCIGLQTLEWINRGTRVMEVHWSKQNKGHDNQESEEIVRKIEFCPFYQPAKLH